MIGRNRRAPLRVVAAVIVENGKLLIAKRYDGAPRGGLWELPGGKVEAGETDEGALVRELVEELGIEARVLERFGSVLHSYSDLTIDLVAYRCEILSGAPAPIGAKETAWVSLAEISCYEFPEADAPLLDRLTKEPVET